MVCTVDLFTNLPHGWMVGWSLGIGAGAPGTGNFYKKRVLQAQEPIQYSVLNVNNRNKKALRC